MGVDEIAPEERERLATLRSLGLLDSEPEERFDRVTRLAQRLFDVPIAVVSLVDENRQWFKSVVGLDVRETEREHSFCAHAIRGDDLMTVPDASADPRFADNPLVTGHPNIRFYAGYPISAPNGAKLGTLCLMDRVPRMLTASDEASLHDLAGVVEREIAFEHLASRDDLTALANRRGFGLLGEKVLDMSRRLDQPAVLLFFDFDGLKAINDTYGHVIGDQALRQFARILEASFRVSDVVARLGGDEFAVLMSATVDPGDAIRRLRAALAEHNLDAPELPLSASVGAAVFDPAGDEDLAGLTVRADTDMYAEKQRGQSA